MHVEQALWSQRFQTGQAPSHSEYEVLLSNSTHSTDSSETDEDLYDFVLLYRFSSSYLVIV